VTRLLDVARMKANLQWITQSLGDKSSRWTPDLPFSRGMLLGIFLREA
jgi:hypothetical protein